MCKINIVNIAVVLLYLVVTTTCEMQPAASENVTFVETKTTAVKVIEKRQAIEASAETASEPEGQNVLGFGSVGIQVLTGLLENMLNTDGMNSQAVGSILNLFNPEKVRNDLLLIRRFFNLFARAGIVLNRYLPAPSTVGNSFKPLDLFKSKIRLYTPEQSENVQWVPIVKNENSNALSALPTRVQTVVDYVTQRPLVASSTEKLEVSNELESTQNLNEGTQTVTEISKGVNVPENGSSAENGTSISTNTSQNYPAQADRNNNFTTEGKTVVDQNIQLEYGLSRDNDKPENFSDANNLLLIENQKVNPTSIGQKPKIGSQQGYGSLSLEYGLPTDEIKQEKMASDERPQVYDLLLQGNQDIHKKTEIPRKISYESATVPAEIRTFDYGLPDRNRLSFRPIQQEYGVPEQSYNNNKLGRGRDKTGLPLRHDSLPNFRQGSRSENKAETNKFPNIAHVPLERHRIFDRMRGPLRDSFGHPIRS